MKRYRKISPLIFVISLHAAASDQTEDNALKLPLGLSVQHKGDVEYEEFRSGGRLERLTVRRNNGVTEIYQNQRSDALWSAEENELGEVRNIRKWIIGSW